MPSRMLSVVEMVEMVEKAMEEISIHAADWPKYLAEVIQRNGFRMISQNPYELQPVRLDRLIASVKRTSNSENYAESIIFKIGQANLALIATVFDGGRFQTHSAGFGVAAPDSVHLASPDEDSSGTSSEERTSAITQLLGLVEEWEFPTEQARRVCTEILPGVLALFLKKNRDYRGNAKHLGYKGQFADINRKFWKLERGWWDGIPLESEPAEEVAADMIGHLLLGLLFAADEGNEDGDE